MSLQNIKTKIQTTRVSTNPMKASFGFSMRWILFCVTFFGHVQVKAWEIDFSRRVKDLETLRLPASIVDQVPQSAKKIPVATTAEREIVILQTEKGFVPSVINLSVGEKYTFHVVNVNPQAKNSSFLLDAFSQNHGTYFGTTKEFSVSPQVAGKFKFQSPESGFDGEINIIDKNSEVKTIKQVKLDSPVIPQTRIPSQSSLPFPKD